MAKPLADLFRHIRRCKDDYLRSATGADFEDRLRAKIDRLGYTRIETDDVEEIARLKRELQAWDHDNPIANNTRFRSHYIFHPAGRQDYPDFMVFAEARIFGIEAKYSAERQGKPVWNSGLPRPNGIYIFGAYGRKDITFFRGESVVSVAEARKLHEFFTKLKEHENKFNANEMQEQPYGFSVYNRKAFDQKKQHNPEAILNYFDSDKRSSLEDEVISYVENNE